MIVEVYVSRFTTAAWGGKEKSWPSTDGSEALVDLLGQSVSDRNLERLWRASAIGLFGFGIQLSSFYGFAHFNG